MTTNIESKIDWTLNYKDALSVLRLIRYRQDDCRKVTEDFPGYNKFKSIDLQLEVLKMKLANQTPSVREIN